GERREGRHVPGLAAANEVALVRLRYVSGRWLDGVVGRVIHRARAAWAAVGAAGATPRATPRARLAGPWGPRTARGGRATGEEERGVQSQHVARCAEAGDLPRRGRRRHRGPAGLRARVAVRGMDLEHGHAHRRDHVAKRDRIVRERARIDDDRAEPPRRGALYPLHQLALAIGLAG